jgi:hypothetical protein
MGILTWVTGILNAGNDTPGYNSENESRVDIENDARIDIDNDSRVANRLFAYLNTGDNESSYNTVLAEYLPRCRSIWHNGKLLLNPDRQYQVWTWDQPAVV